MKPFHQGKLDVFCAIYAVLNGLRLTNKIRTLHARDIFHETLLGLSANPEAFRAALDQRTDYVPLVDGMLRIQTRNLPLVVESPFAHTTGGSTPPPQVVWNCLESWLEQPRRTAIFRFLRHLDHQAPPVNRHWTTAEYIQDDTLQLYDCSHELEAVRSIKFKEYVTRPEMVDREHLLCIEPYTLRLLRPR